MLPYVFSLCWALFVSSAIGSRCGRASLPPNQRLSGPVLSLGLVASTPLVLLLAFRKDVGTDYDAYVRIYNAFRDGETGMRYEPLYALLNLSATPLGDWGVAFVFGVAAALATVLVIWRVLQTSDLPWFSIILLFGMTYPFLATNAVRFAVAIALMFFLLPSVWNRKPALWIAGGIVSSGFHYTAFLMLPFYWILRRDWGLFIAGALFIVAIVFSTQKTLASSFIEWTPAIMPAAYNHYPGLVLERLENYRFGMGYFWYLLSGLFVIVFWRRVSKLGVAEIVIRNAFFLGVVVLIGAYQFWAIGRLGWFFWIAGALYWPMVVCRLISGGRALLLWSLVVVHVVLFVYSLWIGSHGAIPYHSVFH